MGVFLKPFAIHITYIRVTDLCYSSTLETRSITKMVLAHADSDLHIV
jgi:hypothetical protein